MPTLAGDIGGVGIGMDRQHLRMARRSGRAGMNVKFAELAPEGLLAVQIEELVAEEQDLMLKQGSADLPDLTRAGPSQVDAADFGADMTADGLDLDRFI